MQYEYGRIKVLADNLRKFGIEEGIVGRIMEGGEAILKNTSPEKKAAWLGEAMCRMDALLDGKTRQAVREACACCLGGQRLKAVKEIAEKHAGASINERIKAADGVKLVFGNAVNLRSDGSIQVRFQPDNQGGYRCPCLPKASEPISITYCYCCGGHVKHHLQIALGRSLKGTVQSSVLSSGGKKPCTFIFREEGH